MGCTMSKSFSAEWNASNLFPKADEALWRQKAEAVLKGASFEKLVSTTYDGLRIEPIYEQLLEERPRALKHAPGPWTVMARVDHTDATQANALALEDLVGGASGLHLVFETSASSFGFGLPATPSALTTALDGVFIDLIKIVVEPGPAGVRVAQSLATLVAQRDLKPADMDISFGLDPFGLAALNGKAASADDLDAVATCVRDLKFLGFKGPFVVADGRLVHAAGGTEAQELALTLASALAMLRLLESKGMDINHARREIEFRLAADADEFLTLAKFRALRRLWTAVEHGCGLVAEPLRLHGETAWRMMTKRDPWVNMLRGTVATFSAGLGGADSVTVLPFTQPLGLPDAFARRIARNTQSVLLDESNLAKVEDPAAGAGGFETLTDALCQKAWEIFQGIEAEGGYAAAITSGHIQAEIGKAKAARARNIARRKDTLTGTSDYPNIHEAPVDVLAPRPAQSASAPNALSPHRDAESFEALRDLADAYRARTGHAPSVFLANLGPISAFTARTTFAKNFFEAGGIEALGNDGFASIAEMIEAYKSSGAALVCLCSSDSFYAENAVHSAEALDAAGARHIYLAGRPGELESALKTVGVADFIFAGCDVLDVLTKAHARLP